MKKSVWLVLVLSVCIVKAAAQEKPGAFLEGPDAYLGQTPPGEAPKPFLSGISERIAVSPDGKEIYFNQGSGVSCYTYAEGKWNGPAGLFKELGNPALSVDGRTLYLQNRKFEAWYTTRQDGGWSTPVKLFDTAARQHYFQITESGNMYFTSERRVSALADISTVAAGGNGNKIESLDQPVNSANNGQDFFIARDESYLILIVRNIGYGQGDINISFPKKEGGWTVPKNLGAPINSSGWEWGPSVSPDNKYLFFTRDGSVYWVRIDKIIENLRKAN